jgi:hypothetical protein
LETKHGCYKTIVAELERALKKAKDEESKLSDIKSLKRTLARAYLLIDTKVVDKEAIRVDIGTVFSKDEVLGDLKEELQKMGELVDKKGYEKRCHNFDVIKGIQHCAFCSFDSCPDWH